MFKDDADGGPSIGFMNSTLIDTDIAFSGLWSIESDASGTPRLHKSTTPGDKAFTWFNGVTSPVHSFRWHLIIIFRQYATYTWKNVTLCWKLYSHSRRYQQPNGSKSNFLSKVIFYGRRCSALFRIRPRPHRGAFRPGNQ